MRYHRIAGRALATTSVLCAASAGWAHDFFLLPESFVASRAGPLSVRASVGSSFPRLENVVPPDRIERAEAYGAGAPKLSIGAAAADALNLGITGASPGSLVTAVTVKPRDVEYGEDRIPLILEEYRLARDAAAAVEQLPRPRTWKVSSRRFAKSIICIQRCDPHTAAQRPTGAELEFVAGGGERGHFQLLKAGRPLPDYPVDLVGGDGRRIHLATDARGVVHVPAAAKGPHLLFAAFLTPPVTGDRFALDLTSLTFSRE